ncbi:efflux RND transporter permease subunit [Cerasicoccus arenae]|uniref:Multidrug transporter AcrB n=1 Tax=Cerasicoccus arenae TaxID=424488 RepID=A0A8J3DK32_9BACT|nr:efflux RND transporter permease subunit [Cerasicoccus arenae]MBK1858428.1 efflux RND transporter permease subunit [Cerasicoccus arenae]GHC02502.1 multidrug transporter AcrB [Cerasicoccus arenae]
MINWFARNGVAANLLMMVIVIGGLVSLINIKVELFPQFSFDTISVRVPFRGAAPEEVERQIVSLIEEKVQDLDGIKELNATAIEGFGTVTVLVEKGYDVRKLLDDIKSRVDSIDSFPPDAERPIIQENLIRREVLAISLRGDTDERTLKRLAEEVREELLATGKVSQIEIIGVRDYEISIEVTEDTLRRHGLSFNDVVQAVRSTSVDVPGGAIKSDGGEILLRTKGQAYERQQFADIVLISREDGSRILLGEVAKINDGFTDEPLVMRTDGQPGVDLVVYEVGSQNPLGISAQVKEYVKDKQSDLPPGVTISTWRDTSYYLWGRLNMLLENGAIGLLLVLVVLTIFLRPSLAFWVTMGIPISFLGTFLVMPWIDTSVNLISLFGFILVLGIVVDDAIVVGESVFSEFQRSGPGVDSSVRGTKAVATPVTFAVLTTAVAFMPLLMLPGFQGKFLKAIPMVVIPTLLFSLIESKLILPYHLSLCKVGDHKRQKLNIFQRFQRKVADGLERFVDKQYRPVLAFSLHHRYATMAFFVGILLLTVTLIMGGWVKRVPFPAVPSDYIGVVFKYPDGTPASITTDGINRITTALDEVIAQSEAAGRPNPVDKIQSVLGIQAFGGGPGGTMSTDVQSHLGQVVVELAKSELRQDEDSAVLLANRWRDQLGQIPGIKDITFEATAAGGAGEPIDIQLTGQSLEQLRIVANEVKEALRNFDGVFDIRDNLADGQKEIQLKIKPSAEALGLTQAQLGQQVRAAFFGEEAQRVQRGRDDIRVMVRYPREDRESVGNLEQMRIRTADGREVPFTEVAEAKVGLGYAAINRENRQRIVNVYADADKEQIDLEAVKSKLDKEVLPGIIANYEGVGYVFKGEAKEVKEGNESMLSSMLLVLFVMYALLAIPFKSYLQPAIVMFVIPFGLVGAVWGHVIMGHPISQLSNFGIIALAGVVVNDSLVLVDYINGQRKLNVPLLEAVWESGAARFRPILLTSLTTFCGLLPILFERSLQAQFLIPMAISLSFGILFATFITLLLVPAVYLILEDIKHIWTTTMHWMMGHPQETKATPVNPAN